MKRRLSFHDRSCVNGPEKPLPAQGYRVIYADTDAMGMVYHGRYLEMAERSRNHALEAAGLRMRRLVEERNLALVVQSVAMEFLAPLRLDDEITLRTGILNRRTSRVWWRTEVLLGGSRHTLIDVATVCFDREAGRPVAAPDFLRQALENMPTFQRKGRTP